MEIPGGFCSYGHSSDVLFPGLSVPSFSLVGALGGEKSAGVEAIDRMPARAHHPSRRSMAFRFTRNDVSGLTLLELLVVLVLASLLGVLVVQGTGFFLGRYEAATRVGRSSSRAMLQQRWFVSTVQGMVPSLRGDRRFKGERGAFEGLTLRPLATQSGQPTRVRWSIDTGSEGSSAVTYAEEGGREWTVLTLPEPDLSFQYADSADRWDDHWKPDVRSRRGIPDMVRLVSDPGRVVWVARTDLFSEPVTNFRDPR